VYQYQTLGVRSKDLRSSGHNVVLLTFLFLTLLNIEVCFFIFYVVFVLLNVVYLL